MALGDGLTVHLQPLLVRDRLGQTLVELSPNGRVSGEGLRDGERLTVETLSESQ